MTEYGNLTDFLDEVPEYIPRNLGRPAPYTQLKVIDIKTGQSLGPNIDGEICVKGEKLFSGYLNDKKATEESIDSDGWFRTGDIGHYDEENRFYITDRLKEMIKYGLQQVSPIQVEQFLLTHKSVAEVVVVGVKHKTDTQSPRAYVTKIPGVDITEEELKEYVSGLRINTSVVYNIYFADNMNVSDRLRAGVVFVEEIRRTTIGKVDRRYFKQLVANELIDDSL